MEQTEFWKKCSSCKKPISFNSKYYVCSVSTCNGLRTGYVFCTVGCFEAHVPGARHRDSAAVEKMSPASATTSAPAVSSSPQRRIIVSSTTSAPATGVNSPHQKLPREVLIIASRLKEYVAAKNDYNTSASVMDVLSDYVRVLCDRAMDNARAEGRKTLMDRDFEFLKNLK